MTSVGPTNLGEKCWSN